MPQLAAAELTAAQVRQIAVMTPAQLGQLLDDGFDPNARVQGEPMLSRLVGLIREPEQVPTVEALLDAGADVNAKGAMGFTPFLQLLMFGAGSAETTETLTGLFVAKGARLDVLYEPDFDGDGTPDGERALVLATVLVSPRASEAAPRIVMAIEQGARFHQPGGATFATPFFWAATRPDDGALARAFLRAGAEPCFFPAEYADRLVRMFDGVTRAQSAVWEIQWQDALDQGLEDRLATHPLVLGGLIAKQGVCPAREG